MVWKYCKDHTYSMVVLHVSVIFVVSAQVHVVVRRKNLWRVCHSICVCVLDDLAFLRLKAHHFLILLLIYLVEALAAPRVVRVTLGRTFAIVKVEHV